MKSFLRKLILVVARTFRLGQIMRIILADQRQQLCLNRVTADKGVTFGDQAIVHNGDAKRIRVGEHTSIDGELLVHDYGGDIEIGDYTYVGLGTRVWSGEKVRIGSHVFLAHNVNITDTNSHQFSARERMEHFKNFWVNKQPFQKGNIETAPVIIEDHAWINFGVGILKGVRIGEGAIVGAMSLITKDVPPYTLVAGNPARVIRKLEETP